MTIWWIVYLFGIHLLAFVGLASIGLGVAQKIEKHINERHIYGGNASGEYL